MRRDHPKRREFIRYQAGTTSTGYTYTGQYSDSYINLLDYGSRRYDPELGRFIQPDSIIPGSSNSQAYDRYSYVFNNPIRYIDPDGHTPILIAMLVFAGSFILSACASETSTPQQAEIQSLIDAQDHQGAIDKAVELYDIETYDIQATYSENVNNYGETSVSGGTIINDVYVGGTIQVEIGQASFSSPDNLVDTLAHEYVHVEQYFGGRFYTSDSGNLLREIEAYDYVISNADIFEISDRIVKQDTETRKFYSDALDRLDPSLREAADKGIYLLPR